MILSNCCVVTQFYYRIIAMDTFLLFQLHFTMRSSHSFLLLPNISTLAYEVAPQMTANSIIISTSCNGYMMLLLLLVSSIPSNTSIKLNFFMIHSSSRLSRHTPHFNPIFRLSERFSLTAPHRTGRAVFPHPALQQKIRISMRFSDRL